MSCQIDYIPYPAFSDVFVPETDPLAKFVFLPLLSIKITNQTTIGDKCFHCISVWDTGNYEKNYFGEYRTNESTIKFDIIGDKLAYKDTLRFPNLEWLSQAHEIISTDFEFQKDFYLKDLSYESLRHKKKRGADLILTLLPGFGEFEAEYYFERITSHLLSQYRLAKFGVVNPLMNENSIFTWQATNKRIGSEELKTMDFNTVGLEVFADIKLEPVSGNLLGVFFPDDIYIGQVHEWHYNSSAATINHIYYDPEEKKQIQLLEWY